MLTLKLGLDDARPQHCHSPVTYVPISHHLYLLVPSLFPAYIYFHLLIPTSVVFALHWQWLRYALHLFLHYLLIVLAWAHTALYLVCINRCPSMAEKGTQYCIGTPGQCRHNREDHPNCNKYHEKGVFLILLWLLWAA